MLASLPGALYGVQTHMTFVPGALAYNKLTTLQSGGGGGIFTEDSTVRLRAINFTVEARGARMNSRTTIKRLGILLFWAFAHYFFPQFLLATRLGLGIQHYKQAGLQPFGAGNIFFNFSTSCK